MAKRIIGLLLFVVCFAVELSADKIFAKRNGDSKATLIAKDVIIYDITEDDGKIRYVWYFYWHLRAKEVRTGFHQNKGGVILAVEYSEAANRNILIDRIFSKALNARIFDTHGGEFELYGIRVDYGLAPNTWLVGGTGADYPKDDKVLRLKIKDDALPEILRFSQMRSIEFIDDKNVEVVLKDNSVLKGSWYNLRTGKIKWIMALEGFSASGRPLECKLDDVIKIEFNLISKQ